MKFRITSKREGFRRAGRPWSETLTEVDAKDFTRAQLDQLKAEPMLQVAEVDETKTKGKGE